MSQDDPRELLGYQLKHVQAAPTSDLAREAFVTRQTMSTLLRTLVDRGLAQRAAQASSGRALPVQLTPEGRDLLGEASRVTVEVERVMISPLSESQLRVVQEALSVCIAALEE